MFRKLVISVLIIVVLAARICRLAIFYSQYRLLRKIEIPLYTYRSRHLARSNANSYATAT